MTYSIVIPDNHENTKLLADTIYDKLGPTKCLYYGPANKEALNADVIYVGFWTNMGTCDDETKEFLTSLKGKEIFLFGTAGYGFDPAYFTSVISRVKTIIDDSNNVVDYYMCTGKMKSSVKSKYLRMLKDGQEHPNLDMLLKNFDLASTHPDTFDLDLLREKLN